MSASLVGSEMCIRDSLLLGPSPSHARVACSARLVRANPHSHPVCSGAHARGRLAADHVAAVVPAGECRVDDECRGPAGV
eukprot:6423401-Alexandrium_andersonii.AAC.1